MISEVGSFPPIRRTVAKGGVEGQLLLANEAGFRRRATAREAGCDDAGSWLRIADDGGREDAGGYPPPSLMEQFIKKVH